MTIKPFERVPEDGDTPEPIEWVLGRSEEAFAEKSRRAAALHGIRKIIMPAGPYAIVHFGDDHLGDDGCDMPAYRHAIDVIGRTTGMFGGAVGDLLNNWPSGSRLAELWGKQRATMSDAERLAEWSLNAIPWLYRVEGNHDLFNNGGSLLGLLARDAKIGHLAADEIRLELVSPGSNNPLRLWVRHDFPGSSIWNRAHGPMRASMLDPWADVYVAGHKHEWVVHTDEGVDNRVRWSLKVRGFKFHDSYARSLGFAEQKLGMTITTIVNPEAKHPFERVRIVLDVEEAAEILTWLRSRHN